MRIRAHAFLLVLTTAMGCAGTVPVPMVQVPLFRRRGEGEAGFVMGPASRRPEIGGSVRYAATDSLRVGASVSGARGPALSRDGETDPSEQAPKLFADGFVGGEWGGFAFRYGALAGSGYGLRSALADCSTPSRSAAPCSALGAAAAQSAFVRSYGQLHLAFAPPGPLAVSVALRVPVVVELPEERARRSTELGTEVALTQTLRLSRLRVDLQPLWSRTRGFAFHLALLLRFDVGAAD